MKIVKERFAQVKDRTMIGGLGILANMDAIDYLCQNKISGAVVSHLESGKADRLQP